MTDLVDRLRELRGRALQCKGTPGEKEAAFDYGATAMTALPGLLDEIERLRIGAAMWRAAEDECKRLEDEVERLTKEINSLKTKLKELGYDEH